MTSGFSAAASCAISSAPRRPPLLPFTNTSKGLGRASNVDGAASETPGSTPTAAAATAAAASWSSPTPSGATASGAAQGGRAPALLCFARLTGPADVSKAFFTLPRPPAPVARRPGAGAARRAGTATGIANKRGDDLRRRVWLGTGESLI
jgi:hypothetical protein